MLQTVNQVLNLSFFYTGTDAIRKARLKVNPKFLKVANFQNVDLWFLGWCFGSDLGRYFFGSAGCWYVQFCVIGRTSKDENVEVHCQLCYFLQGQRCCVSLLFVHVGMYLPIIDH